MNWVNFAWMKGQHAPTACPAFSARQALRSLPVQTASISRNFSAGTTTNQSRSALVIVIRMLVGELNSFVRRKPTKPVVFTGAGRSGTRSRRTNEGVVISQVMSLMEQGSVQ